MLADVWEIHPLPAPLAAINVAEIWAVSHTAIPQQAAMYVTTAIIPHAIVHAMPLWICRKSRAAVFGKGAF